MTRHSPIRIANYFIEKAKEDSSTLGGIEKIKVMKLVYIAHGYHLAIFDEPLLNCVIESYRYGPLIRPLFYELRKVWDDKVVKKKLTHIPHIYSGSLNSKLSDEQLALLDKIWSVYGAFSGLELTSICHRYNSIWFQVLKERPYHQDGDIISDERIKEHYRQIIFERRNNDV